MIKCPECGVENPSDVGLCKSCGARIPMMEDAIPNVAPGSFEEQILALLQGGKKIEAIKLYREKTGKGLKEAKDAVEALAKEHNITPSKAGCAGVLLIVAAGVFILLKYACAV
jgi:ribosomal protein L7/L12